MGQDYLDVAAAARLLGLKESAILRLVAGGDIPARGWPPRIRRQDLDGYLERCRVKSGQLAHLDPNTGKRPPPGKVDVPLTQRGVPDRRFGRR